MECGGLHLLPGQRVEWCGRRAKLPRQQFLLLELLIKHRDAVVTHDRASGVLMHHAKDCGPGLNEMASVLSQMRRTLRALGCDLAICTVHGEGRLLLGVHPYEL